MPDVAEVNDQTGGNADVVLTLGVGVGMHEVGLEYANGKSRTPVIIEPSAATKRPADTLEVV